MEKLRVFLSSTCYDLNKERIEIQKHLTQLGHMPILSDKNAIRYDPDKSTHASCLDTVEHGSDYLVAIISSRFGGPIFRDAFKKHINIELLKTKSKAKRYFDSNKFSIAQCEVLKGIEKGIPCLVFVEKKMTDERKKYQDAIKAGRSNTPFTLQNPDSIYIFEFIGFVNNLYRGNGTYEYKYISEIKKIIADSFSNHFKEILTEKNKTNTTKYPILIPSDLNSFGKKIYQKLTDQYKKQKARINIENKLIFDENCNCFYSLNVNVNPINDFPLYHFQIIADKDGDIDLKKVRNIDTNEEDSYIGFKNPKKLDIFFFNNSANLKAPFNIELHLYIENYLSDLLDEGKGQLTKSLHGKSVTYTFVNQKIYFEKKIFRNLKIICKQHPDLKKIDEELKPIKNKKFMEFEYTYKANTILNKKNPCIRFEVTKD